MQNCCLIVPCYNEETRLPLEEIRSFLNKNPEIKLLLVNDGSKDRTLEKIREFSLENPKQVQYLDQQPNAGKAEAVRQGMLRATQQFPGQEYYGFWDADMSTPLEELHWFEVIGGGTFAHKMIVGTRLSRLGAEIQRSMMRHYLGRIFATFASIILDLPVYDTQCGAKIIHHSLIQRVFEKPFKTKWLFDVEIFARIKQILGRDELMRQTLEVPLRVWKDVKGSKLRLMDFGKVPLDLIRIKMHY